jgi:hypothetical protein
MLGSTTARRCITLSRSSSDSSPLGDHFMQKGPLQLAGRDSDRLDKELEAMTDTSVWICLHPPRSRPPCIPPSGDIEQRALVRKLKRRQLLAQYGYGPDGKRLAA